MINIYITKRIVYLYIIIFIKNSILYIYNIHIF